MSYHEVQAEISFFVGFLKFVKICVLAFLRPYVTLPLILAFFIDFSSIWMIFVFYCLTGVFLHLLSVSIFRNMNKIQRDEWRICVKIFLMSYAFAPAAFLGFCVMYRNFSDHNIYTGLVGSFVAGVMALFIHLKEMGAVETHFSGPHSELSLAKNVDGEGK